MKKSALILSTVTSSLLSISPVAAQEILPAPPVTSQQFLTFFTSLLTGAAPGTVDIFARFLLLILLITVLTKPAELITKTRTPAIIIASIVSILGIRFLSNQMISGVLLPYGTVAIIVSVFVPFLLLIYFLNDIPFAALRKVGWLMTAVVFLGLWWFRFQQIGAMAYVYALTAILSVMLFFFDRTIQNLKIKLTVHNEKDAQIYIQITVLQQRINVNTGLLPTATPGSPQEKAILDNIKKDQNRINTLLKQLG